MLLAGREEVAIRIPDDDRVLAVLRRTGPLLVTSANLHGAATPESLADALAQLDGAPDLAIDGGSLNTVPSTLVNCRRDPPVVEREGAIPGYDCFGVRRRGETSDRDPRGQAASLGGVPDSDLDVLELDR